MALSITVSVTGTATQDDARAARYIVARENERRATLIPPVAALPTGTAAELRASYQTILGAVITSSHTSYVQQSTDHALRNEFRTAFEAATDQQRAAALSALQG